MEKENLDLASINEARREALKKTIKPISLEELKKLADSLFPYLDHPWREPYLRFLEENSGSPFYHGDAGEGLQIICCPAKDRGVWYFPNAGVGPMQPAGVKTIKEIIVKK